MTSSPTPRRSPMLVPALATAVVAISFAAILFRMAPALHPLTAAGWRLVIAGLVLTPFARHAPRAPLALTGAGLAYALHFGAWVASLGLVSVMVSVTAVTTTPLMLALVGLATGRDRPRPRALAGLALGTLGVASLALTLSSPEAPARDGAAGIGLALVGAAAMAAYLLIARRARLTTMRASLGFAGVAALVGGAVLLACAAAIGAPLLPASRDEAWVVIGAAALPQLVGHTLLTWALTQTSPTTVALTTLGEPIGATLLAAALLGERLTGLGIAACALTLGAVALALSDAGGGEH